MIKSPLMCKHFHNAIVLPFKRCGNRYVGGITDSCGNFIKQSRFNFQDGDKYLIDKENTKREAQVSVFIAGLLYPAWGHTFTDDVKYLWWLLSDEFKRLKESGIRVQLVCIKSAKIENLTSLQRTLEWLGIKEEVVLVDEPTIFSDLYFPSPCLEPGDKGERYWSLEYKALINTIKENILRGQTLTTTPKRVYFSRTQIARKRDFGEQYVEEAFRRAGYYIYHPEKLPIAEQVKILSNCEIFCSTEGSIGHNAMFLKDGGTAVIIRKANYINPYQITIGEMKQLNTILIDANKSFLNNKKNPMIGPFFIYMNRHLADFLHQKKFFPISEFLRYIRWSIFHRDIILRIFAKRDFL